MSPYDVIHDHWLIGPGSSCGVRVLTARGEQRECEARSGEPTPASRQMVPTVAVNRWVEKAGGKGIRARAAPSSGAVQFDPAVPAGYRSSPRAVGDVQGALRTVEQDADKCEGLFGALWG